MNIDHTSELVFATLRQIIRAIDLQSKQLTKTHGLTGPQLLILKALQKKNVSTTISDISKQASLSQATVTSILDRLEQQGLVERKRSSTDKRRVDVILNEKAKLILDIKPSLLQDEFMQKFQQLEDWEQTLLLSSLQRIASMMNADKIVRSQSKNVI